MKTSLKIRQEAERLSLLIALVLVLVSAVLTYRAWAAFERNRQEAQLTRQVVDGTTALLSSLKDAEAGQRGFLLTGSDLYLEPYRHALAEIPANLDALARLESGRDPVQLRRVETLKPLVRAKMGDSSKAWSEPGRTSDSSGFSSVGWTTATVGTAARSVALARVRSWLTWAEMVSPPAMSSASRKTATRVRARRGEAGGSSGGRWIPGAW